MARKKKRIAPPTPTFDEAEFTEELPVDGGVDEAEFTETVDAPAIPEPTRTPAPAQAPGGVEAFLRSGANAITLGWGDELSARLAAMLPGGDVSNIDRDAARIDAERRAAAEANPRSAMAGSFVGGATVGAPIALATGGTTLPALMGLGAAEGAIQSVGEAPQGQPAIDTTFDALGAGMTGAALPMVGQAVAPMLRGAGSTAREWAETAARRIGDVAGEARVRAAYPFSAKKGVTTTQYVMNRPGGLAAQGRAMREAGITGLTPEAHRARAESLRIEYGPRVDESVRAMDEAGAVAELTPNDVERIRVMLRGADARGALPARATRERLASPIPEETGRVPVQVRPSEAWGMRRQVDDYTDFASEGVTAKERQNLYNDINARIGFGAEAVDPRLAQDWRNASRDYALAAEVEDSAAYSAERGAGSAGNPGGLMRGMMGSMGGASMGAQVAQSMGGGPMATTLASGVGGALGAAGMRGVTGRWQGMKAASLESLSDVLEMAPERLGAFGNVLGQAFQRGGGQGLAAAHYKLNANNPSYRSLMRQIGVIGSSESDGAYIDPEEL